MVPKYFTLKMEAEDSSEPLVSMYGTMQRHMSDDLRNLDTDRRANHKFHIVFQTS
jgi:hypothetical protein